MLSRHHSPDEPIGIHWQRPVLPDPCSTSNPVESPISRRLLRDLQLATGDRVLAVGAQDPQFVELAADAVGPRGHVTCIEPDLDRLRRLRARTVSFGAAVAAVAELPPRSKDRYDAIALVVRTRAVPDRAAVHRLCGLLDPGGRLAVVAFESPAGLVASSCRCTRP